jgi:LEA14-like dessication related protein
MKNITRLFFVFLFISLAGCQLEAPELKNIEQIGIDEVGKSSVKITLWASIDNPNNYGFTVTEADLDVYINSTRIGKVVLDKNVKIKANRIETYPVELSAGATNLIAGAIQGGIQTLLKGKVNLRVKGNVKARRFLFSKKFPVDYQAEVPVKLNRKKESDEN